MLKVKLLDMGDPRSLLSTALSPPHLNDIERTVLQLKEVYMPMHVHVGGCRLHVGLDEPTFRFSRVFLAIKVGSATSAGTNNVVVHSFLMYCLTRSCVLVKY